MTMPSPKGFLCVHRGGGSNEIQCPWPFHTSHIHYLPLLILYCLLINHSLTYMLHRMYKVVECIHSHCMGNLVECIHSMGEEL